MNTQPTLCKYVYTLMFCCPTSSGSVRDNSWRLSLTAVPLGAAALHNSRIFCHDSRVRFCLLADVSIRVRETPLLIFQPLTTYNSVGYKNIIKRFTGLKQKKR